MFVKCDGNKLNILDVEEKFLTLRNPVELDEQFGMITTNFYFAFHLSSSLQFSSMFDDLKRE